MENLNPEKTVKSTCGFCPIGCGIIACLSGDKVLKIYGDPEHPLNKGRLCPKGEASLEYLYHPDRIKFPLKRTGPRGSLEWERISWDQALEDIAGNLEENKEKCGPETVAFVHGASKGLQDSYLTRLANAFGSPNVAWQGHVCFVPRMLASAITYGFYAVPDYDNIPSCIVVWGKNTLGTLHHAHQRILTAVNNGAKLIVIDPRQTELAQVADIWLQLRPGSDLALALAMLQEIISKGLFDEDFVRNWTVGFEELTEHIQSCSPDQIAEYSGVPAEKIRQAARLYASSKPACIQWGNAIDQGVDNFQTARAVCILRSVTGNIGAPGGEIQPLPVPLNGRRTPQLELWDEVPSHKRNKNIGADIKLPMIKHIEPQNLIKAIIEERPYAIRSVFIQGANPLLTYPDAQKVYKALVKTSFLAVSEMFMTPTAALADIVLPAASCLEFDSIVTSPYSYPVASVQQKLTRVGESRSDYEILYNLAKKLGLGHYFWSSEQQCLDKVLEPTGIAFEEFRNIAYLPGQRQYRHYKTKGFSTPSGKIELYSNQLKDCSFDPLPGYQNFMQDNDQTETGSKYPYVLTTWKSKPFRHSGGRQVTSLRGMHPDPLVHIHPETAEQEKIRDGQWVKIQTPKGTIVQKARLTSQILPMVLGLDYAWWYPEQDQLFAWKKSNVNIIIDDEPPYSPETAAPKLRGIRCRISKE